MDSLLSATVSYTLPATAKAPSSSGLQARLDELNIRYCTLVVILCSIDVLGPFATDSTVPSMPDMASDLDTTVAWVQMTILLYSVVMSFSTLLGGAVSDRWGRRPATLIGIFLFILGDFGCVFSPNITILNISRVVQALGGGMSTIVSNSVARDVFEQEERLQILGVLGTIRPAAIAGAPSLGGIISDFFGWRAVYTFTGSVAVLVFIVTLIVLPETRNRFFVETAAPASHNEHPVRPAAGSLQRTLTVTVEDETVDDALLPAQSSAHKDTEHFVLKQPLFQEDQPRTSTFSRRKNSSPEPSGIELNETVGSINTRSLTTQADVGSASDQNVVNAEAADDHELQVGYQGSSAPYQNLVDSLDPSFGSELNRIFTGPAGKNQKKSKKKPDNPQKEPLISDSNPPAGYSEVKSDPDTLGSVKKIDLEASHTFGLKRISVGPSDALVDEQSNLCREMCKAFRFACMDRIFLFVCIVNFFRFVGVATFLTEFAFEAENFYGFSSTVTGFMLGGGASCLIAGSILSMKLGKVVDPSEERKGCMKCCKGGMKEIDILRIGCLIGLLSAALLNVWPVLMYDTYSVNDSEISGGGCVDGWHWKDFDTYWKCYVDAMDQTEWYMTLIPFCVYTTAAGMINPPATVILLEPYPEIAGLMSGISTVWTYAFSYSFVILLTQILTDKMSEEPFVVHMVLGCCGVMLTFVSWVVISKKKVQARMGSGKGPKHMEIGH